MIVLTYIIPFLLMGLGVAVMGLANWMRQKREARAKDRKYFQRLGDK